MRNEFFRSFLLASTVAFASAVPAAAPAFAQAPDAGTCGTAPALTAQSGAQEAYLGCLLAAGHAFDAVSHGETIVRSGGETPAILSHLGMAYSLLQDDAKALTFLENARDADLEDPLIALRLGKLLQDRVLRLSPEENRDRRAEGLAHCATSDIPPVQARREMRALAKRADDLLRQAANGFTARGDRMKALEARHTLAMLHVNMEGEAALPEFAAFVEDARRVGEDDPQMADMAALYLMNLSTAHASFGHPTEARLAADEALSSAHSESVRRLVAAGTSSVREEAGTVDLKDIITASPPCEIDIRLDVAR